MKTKCTGLMGRIFGHKFVGKMRNHRVKKTYYYHYVAVCQRCGAVTGEKK